MLVNQCCTKNACIDMHVGTSICVWYQGKIEKAFEIIC